MIATIIAEVHRSESAAPFTPATFFPSLREDEKLVKNVVSQKSGKDLLLHMKNAASFGRAMKKSAK